MNEKAIAALVDAAMRGVRQIRYRLNDNQGGFCAVGVISAANAQWSGMYDKRFHGCPFCGILNDAYYKMPIHSEAVLIIHLNNDHEWDFLTIARKMESLSTPEPAA